MTTERKILCVEDNLDTCEIITRLIEGTGRPYRVTSAHNTEDALVLIEAGRFDLYVLDTWMPEMGGLQLCKTIRETESTTPIVFFTAIVSKANRQRALAAGANEFLRKPDDLDKLIPTVTRLLEGVDEVLV